MRTRWPVTICAFAAGVVAGLLLAPKFGQETRRKLVSKARARLHELEKQLHSMETHLRHIEQQVQALGERFRKAGTVEAWKLENQDIARELPRMPHG